MPRIVGSCFDREAAQWYFEHGCMGYHVDLDSLRMTLGADVFGTGTIAKACTLRSLCVAIDSTSIGSFGTTASFYNIEEQLRALLKLKLNLCFILTTRVVWDHQRYIDARRLQELAPALNTVIHAFKQSGYKTVLEYRIHPCYAVDSRLNKRAQAHEQLTTPCASKARDFHLVQGTEAERMLTTTSERWYFHIVQQDVLRGSGIIF
jgi:hypothetical protein